MVEHLVHALLPVLEVLPRCRWIQPRLRAMGLDDNYRDEFEYSTYAVTLREKILHRYSLTQLERLLLQRYEVPRFPEGEGPWVTTA